MRKYILLTLFFVSFFSIKLFVFCQDKVLQPFEVLKKIKFDQVLVEKQGKVADEIGLTEERIRTVAELRLRKEALLAEPPSHLSELEKKILRDFLLYLPKFSIFVNVVGPAFSIEVKVIELVPLPRIDDFNSEVKSYCLATIWEMSATGIHGNNSEYIISGINQLIDSFLNDYYKANPKK